MNSVRMLLLMAVLATLAGCMGSGHKGAYVEAYVDAERAYLHATGDFQTPNVPTSGTARYEGIAEVSAVDETRNTKDVYIGLATYGAAFTSTGGRISGDVSDFVVLENLGVNEDPVNSSVSCGGYCIDADAARVRISADLRPAKPVSGQITLAEAPMENGVFYARASGSVDHGPGGETTFDGIVRGSILGSSGQVVSVNDVYGHDLDPNVGTQFAAMRNGEALTGRFRSKAVDR